MTQKGLMPHKTKLQQPKTLLLLGKQQKIRIKIN